MNYNFGLGNILQSGLVPYAIFHTLLCCGLNLLSYTFQKLLLLLKTHNITYINIILHVTTWKHGIQLEFLIPQER